MNSKNVDLKLDWCSYKAAEYACENWHYSKRMPINKLVKIGVWEDGLFKGVIIFGSGASAQVHKQFNVGQMEFCELVRVALRNHKTQVSKLIKIAIKNFLLKKCPKIRVIVSFADSNQNHHGGIYQAGNWIYTGMSNPTTEYFYRGDWRHVTGIYKRGLSPEKIKSLKSRTMPGKHRYVMVIDKLLESDILKTKKPYPKRVEHESNASGNQPEEGGAIPTDTLQETIK